MENYLSEVDAQILHLKSEMFEVRQLLKYAFKEDILDEKPSRSPSPPPKKDFLAHNKALTSKKAK